MLKKRKEKNGIKTAKRKFGREKSNDCNKETRRRRDIIKAVEDLYRDLYKSDEQPEAEVNAAIREAPNITAEEIKGV